MLKKEKKEEKLKLVIQGYDSRSVDEATKMVYSQLSDLKVKFSGAIPLPTKKVVVTLPISPHKHKKSQEAFVQNRNRRMFSIKQISPKNLEILGTLKI